MNGADRFRGIKGWGILLGVPAVFLAARLLPHLPGVAEMNVCAVRGFLGVPCPGCGLTHAFIALAQGDLRGSVDAHPLGVVIALWLLVLFGRAAWTAVMRRPPRELLTQRQRDWCLAAFLGALFLQWFVKLALIWLA